MADWEMLWPECLILREQASVIYFVANICLSLTPNWRWEAQSRVAKCHIFTQSKSSKLFLPQEKRVIHDKFGAYIL